MVRQSPRKMRLVMDLIRGKDVNEAYAILQYNKKLAAKQIAKTLKSAVANAEQKALRGQRAVRRGRPVRQEGDHQRWAQPLKRFTAGGPGPGDPDPQADQPRGDPRGDEGERVMGQKTHPIGFRLGIVKQWKSRWYATQEMPALLKEDELIRKYLKARLGHAAIAEVHIERRPGKVTVTIHTGRPGVVIGKRGAEVDKLRDELAQLTGKEVGGQRRGDQAARAVGPAGGRQHRRASSNSASRSAAP